jgi:cobalt-zinc-cadmium efflux system protein
MSTHHHHHDHTHAPTNHNRAFVIGVTLNVAFVIIEAGYGFAVNSLALLADAGHNLSDVLGLLLAWGASFLASRPPTKRYTYGLRRSSILAALFNAILLLVAMGGIAWEAVRSFTHENHVPGITIIIVALIGVAINTGTALLFMAGREKDLNIRGAFLHMAADALVSVGVVFSGIAILATGWYWFDPAMSLIIVLVVVYGTWQLLKDSMNLALDGVPANIEPLAVQTYLGELPGVEQVHDLHIWAMSTTDTALTVHLVMPAGFPGDAFLTKLSEELHEHFDIDHVTIQIETDNINYPCSLAADHVI